MSIMTLILGGSGQGKSTSLRNMDPKDVFLIKVINKKLPFRAKGWTTYKRIKDKDGNVIGDEGNFKVSDNSAKIADLVRNCEEATGRHIIVIDDAQYSMANNFLRKTGAGEKGFDKFNDIGFDVWSIIKAASELPDYMRVYFLWHPDVEDDGRIKAKTVGKITDKYITPEGYFLLCLYAYLEEDSSGIKGYFKTNSANPLTPFKSPMDMFPLIIENDLDMVDKRIVEYFSDEEGNIVVPKDDEGKGEEDGSSKE